jgi:hypothetical protein
MPISVSTSIWSFGSSSTKRERAEACHWPWMRRFAAKLTRARRRARVRPT